MKEYLNKFILENKNIKKGWILCFVIAIGLIVACEGALEEGNPFGPSNSLFSLRKIAIFQFRASEKRLKIDAKIDLEKSIEKNFSKIDFRLQVDLPKLPKIHKKQKKIEKNCVRKKGYKASTVAELASTQPTLETKPKTPPKRHPFT